MDLLLYVYAEMHKLYVYILLLPFLWRLQTQRKEISLLLVGVEGHLHSPEYRQDGLKLSSIHVFQSAEQVE